MAKRVRFRTEPTQRARAFLAKVEVLERTEGPARQKRLMREPKSLLDAVFILRTAEQLSAWNELEAAQEVTVIAQEPYDE
jgi:hypothetical protein